MRTLVVLLAVTALVGCKTDKKATGTTTTGSGSAGSAVATGSGSDTMTGSGSGSSEVGSGSGTVAKAPAITLPKGPGTPPNKTTKTLEKADFERLAKLDYPGFKKDILNETNALDVRHTTPRPMISTTVTIAKCFQCTPMDLEKWKTKEATLKALLPEELRNRPDTIFEIGKTEAAGVTVMYTYQFGQFYGKDEAGPTGSFTNAYILYFNDGVNQIRVVAQYKDDPASREDMLAIAPKDDLERLAKAFFDAYTHQW